MLSCWFVIAKASRTKEPAMIFSSQTSGTAETPRGMPEFGAYLLDIVCPIDFNSLEITTFLGKRENGGFCGKWRENSAALSGHKTRCDFFTALCYDISQ